MWYAEMRYNLNFDVAAILLDVMFLSVFFFRKNLRIRRNRLYAAVILSALLSAVGNLLSSLIRNGTYHASVEGCTAVTAVTHLVHNSLGFLLLLYFLELIGEWKALTRLQKILTVIPEGILVMILAVPFLRRLIFYYDSRGRYVHGVVYTRFYYGLTAVYFLAGLFLLYRFRRRLIRRDRIALLIFCAGLMLSMLTQLNPYLKMTDFLQTICLVGMYLSLESNEDTVDSVTGLMNRYALRRHTCRLYESSVPSWVIGIRIKDYNYYEHVLGGDTTDGFLKGMGIWLRHFSSDAVGVFRPRRGAFALLVQGSSREDAILTAETIRQRFSEEWIYRDSSVVLQAQICLAEIPSQISTESQLFQFIDSEYNEALPPDRVFVADNVETNTRRLEVEEALDRALKQGTLEVYYQPIYDTKSKTIHSCEALSRLTDEKLGSVSPEEFIRVAEQTGKIIELSSFVMEKVCRFIHEKNPRQYGLDFIEVNLSTVQCMDRSLTLRLQEIMHRYQVGTDQISLEITESAVIHNENTMKNVTSELHKMGFSFALDDFGTGNANYSYILNYPFELIKVDKSFLWSAEKNKESLAIIQNMLQLIRALHKKAVVEGVETAKHVDFLEKEGIEYMQGFYFSRAIPEDDFLTYIRNFNRREQNPA